ncbi:hypothetical protein FACS189496_4480 [Bacilli bacterium]|nr:hypothetical protein FACS189496_4480 [Bacilli bacterium]
MKKIKQLSMKKILPPILALAGVFSIVVPISLSCSNAVVLKITTTGFDITKKIKPVSLTNDDIYKPISANKALKM